MDKKFYNVNCEAELIYKIKIAKFIKVGENIYGKE
jgi:hypothetical protein